MLVVELEGEIDDGRRVVGRPGPDRIAGRWRRRVDGRQVAGGVHLLDEEAEPQPGLALRPFGGGQDVVIERPGVDPGLAGDRIQVAVELRRPALSEAVVGQARPGVPAADPVLLDACAEEPAGSLCADQIVALEPGDRALSHGPD